MWGALTVSAISAVIYWASIDIPKAPVAKPISDPVASAPEPCAPGPVYKAEIVPGSKPVDTNTLIAEARESGAKECVETASATPQQVDAIAAEYGGKDYTGPTSGHDHPLVARRGGYLAEQNPPMASIPLAPPRAVPGRPVAVTDRCGSGQNSSRRAENGERFGIIGGGLGTLTITNGTTGDATVRLRSVTEPEDDGQFIYVRSKSSATMSGIDRGTYTILYQFGADFDAAEEAFLCDRATSMFEQPAVFAETPTQGGVEYDTPEITLQPVINGNAKTRRVDDALFRRHK